MFARKKPVKIEYYPCEKKYLDKIMEWSTEERPIESSCMETTDGEITLWITTLEGLHQATKKDVIIKGVDNEVYPCKKDIFEKTYDYEK